MESPPPPLPAPCYISQSSKKRVLRGSSLPSMEDDVVEIPPLTNRSTKLKLVEENEVTFPEIIDVDMDEDYEDVMLVDKEVDTKGKGKEVFGKFPLGSSSGTNPDSGNGVQSSEESYASSSQYLIDGDDFGADLFYGENEYVDEYHDDHFYDEQYAVIQAHLDSLNIPPGVEFSVPWFTSQLEDKMESAVASTLNNSSSPISLDNLAFPLHSDSSSSVWPMESTSQGNSSLGDKLKANGQSKKWEPSSSWLYEDSANVKNWPSADWSSVNLPSKTTKDAFNFFSKMQLLNSHRHSAKSWRSKTKSSPPVAQSMSGGGSLNRFSNHVSSTMKHPSSGTLTGLASHSLEKLNVQPGVASHGHLGNSPLTGLASHIQPGALSYKPVWLDRPKNTIGQSLIGAPYPPAFVYKSRLLPNIPDNMAFGPWDVDPIQGHDIATAPGNSSGSFSSEVKYGDPSEFLKNFDLFKRFDTIQDSTDHYYSKNGSSVKQPSKNWAKKIQEEWRILENDLPDTIFVRVYESRMDILRAVIVGAEGTPYHDGLFFFDVFFPSNYPNVPPHVHYHSGGLDINPNLYGNGKVCLSLLNTWAGSPEELWIPGVSTILQVLVSIQGLILNAKPYFNEPGYASMSGTRGGESSSLKYNEKTFIKSLKTMVYNIRRPPKYFEDLVAGHFYKRAHDILVACKAYIDGAQVGCLVKGGVPDVDEGDKSCSQHFKNTLAEFISTLVNAFAKIGVKDCDEFLSLAQKTNTPVSAAPMTPNYYC